MAVMPKPIHQFTVEHPGQLLDYFVFSPSCPELEEFKAWCMKWGVVVRPSTQEEIDWVNDPEFKMDSDTDDEPCFHLPDEEAELIMSIKDW